MTVEKGGEKGFNLSILEDSRAGVVMSHSVNLFRV